MRFYLLCVDVLTARTNFHAACSDRQLQYSGNAKAEHKPQEEAPNMDSGESSEGELLVLVLALISPLAVG